MFQNILSILSNLFFFALHIDSKNIFPKPLSRREEAGAFRLMAEGDDTAKAKLIEHNLRLVAHIIKKYYSNIKEQDELISIGTIGLIKAVSSFDYSKGNRFATYASRCIENAILTLRLFQNILIHKIKLFLPHGKSTAKLTRISIFYIALYMAGYPMPLCIFTHSNFAPIDIY